MSGRFAPRGPINPNSRGAKISAAIHGPTAAMLDVIASTPALTHRMLPDAAVSHSAATAAPGNMSCREPAAKAQSDNRPVAAPKPMKVPSDVEAMGPESARAYCSAFRETTARSLRLIAHPAARGRHISLGQLIGQGLDDAQIIARLPQGATDTEQRAMMRRAEVGAMWDRAIAKAFGQPIPAAPSSQPNSTDELWTNAITANNPGHKF